MEHATQRLVTDDGVAISLDCYQEPGRDVALIICPGFFQSKETLTFQRLACALVSVCDVLSMDFRGHGRSSGLYTFSALEEADLSAAARWAYTRYRRIGILGFSLGAATAINFVSHHHQIKTLIAVSAPYSFDEIEFEFWTTEAIRTGLKGLETGAGCRPGNLWRKKTAPIDRVQELSPVPVLFIHGTNDPIVQHRHSQTLFERAGQPKRLELFERGGHAEELYRSDPNRFLEVVKGWLAETLLDPGELTGSPQYLDGYFTAPGGVSLYYQQWGAGQSRAPMVIVHGAGEHVGRYADTVARLNQEGFAVYLFDLPGHGRSPGKRGHVRRFSDYVDSLDSFTKLVAGQYPHQRPIMFGHSLGGLIATCFAAEHPERLQCLVLSSPLFGLSLAVPWWKRVLAYLLDPFWPSLTMERSKNKGSALLSHDPQVELRDSSDPLVHRRASVRVYVEVRRLLKRLPSLVRRLRVPVLVLQAGDDRVASAEATARLFPLVGSTHKKLVTYTGYYHEILNEIGKESVFRDLVNWLRGMPSSETTGDQSRGG